MNDDFEQRLQTLRCAALPAEWKAQILGHAVAPPIFMSPPRWLAVTWGVAWAAVIVLRLTSVPEPAGPVAGPNGNFEPALKARAQTLNSLLTLNDGAPLSIP